MVNIPPTKERLDPKILRSFKNVGDHVLMIRKKDGMPYHGEILKIKKYMIGEPTFFVYIESLDLYPADFKDWEMV